MSFQPIAALISSGVQVIKGLVSIIPYHDTRQDGAEVVAEPPTAYLEGIAHPKKPSPMFRSVHVSPRLSWVAPGVFQYRFELLVVIEAEQLTSRQ